MAVEGVSIPIRFSCQGGTRWERRHSVGVNWRVLPHSLVCIPDGGNSAGRPPRATSLPFMYAATPPTYSIESVRFPAFAGSSTRDLPRKQIAALATAAC